MVGYGGYQFRNQHLNYRTVQHCTALAAGWISLEPAWDDGFPDDRLFHIINGRSFSSFK